MNTLMGSLLYRLPFDTVEIANGADKLGPCGTRPILCSAESSGEVTLV